MTIHITRGDTAAFTVTATIGDEAYTFKPDDVVRFKVFVKKSCDDVVLSKSFNVTEETTEVEIYLNGYNTAFGDIISKPTDYWYEVELNPDTKPQTIVGYDEDGAKVFKLYPEGGVANE
jgi:hypothetical protein